MSLKEMQSLINAPTISAESLMRCALGIRITEIAVYCALQSSEPSSVQEIALRLGKSRPTTQRLLQNLVKKELATREERLIGLGGYKYCYSAIPAERMQVVIAQKLEKWYLKMLHELESLPEKIEELQKKCTQPPG
jgi:predicted transcriptional regulator